MNLMLGVKDGELRAACRLRELSDEAIPCAGGLTSVYHC
jgi:hypothetical protein